MKKILTIIFTIIFFTSCKKDFLNVAPGDRLSNTTFWRNADDAVQATTGVYSSWSSSHIYQQYFADDWSDDAIPSGFWQGFYYFTWGKGNISPSNGDISGYWSALYSVIRTSNVFLANVDKCVMDDNLKARLKGEVQFVRAYEYYLLYNNWGEVPLVDKPLSPGEVNIGRGALGSTVAFILADLNAAIPNLPTVASQAGRITKGAALTLKARILLTTGQYAEAATTAKMVMDQGNYELLRTTAGDGYKQLTNTKQANNKEEILAWQFDGSNVNNDFISNVNGLSGSLVSPTKALVDAYDGYNKTTDMVVPVNETTTTSRFANRDPRLDFTVGHTGSVVKGITLNSESGELAAHATGYGVIKYITNEVINNTPKYSTDYMLMRYAEVLLIYAEAKIEAGQIDPSVINAINDVRSRAYGTVPTDITHYPEVILGTQAALRNIVRNERRVELAFEGLRWFDIKRWSIAAGTNGTMNGTVLGAYLSSGTYKVAGARQMDNPNRDYLRPIPQDQINLMGKNLLPQNPGYN